MVLRPQHVYDKGHYTNNCIEPLLDPLSQFLSNCPLALLELVLGLRAQDVASPVDTGAVVVLGLEGVDQLGKLTLILLKNE